MLLRKHPNVYADVSTNFGRDEGSFGRPLLDLLAQVKGWAGSIDRILFGSDYPLYDQVTTLRAIDWVLSRTAALDDAGLTPEEVARVRDANPAGYARRIGLFRS